MSIPSIHLYMVAALAANQNNGEASNPTILIEIVIEQVHNPQFYLFYRLMFCTFSIRETLCQTLPRQCQLCLELGLRQEGERVHSCLWHIAGTKHDILWQL